MTFLWPWSLLALAAVAVVAAWALFRPVRQLVVVGSLELWQKALQGLSPASRRRSRAMSASWIALFAGAALAVLAAGRPAYYWQGPQRTVAIAVCPSAELAGSGGMESLRSAVDGVLARLSPADRVQLLLPDVLGGASEFLSPQAARAKIDSLRALPAAGRDLTFSPAGPVQHVYRFVPAGLATPAGPGVSVVEVSTSLPAITFDALGAEQLPGGQVQVFVALRNQTSKPVSALLVHQALGADGPVGEPTGQAVVIGPLGRQAVIWAGPAFDGLSMHLTIDGQAVTGPGSCAFLARLAIVKSKVAMIGPDEPLVRRFVQINPSLELVASAAEADFIIANVDPPPADKPSLVIHTARLPQGWSPGESLENFELFSAALAADAPMLQGVDFAGVIVRRMETWDPAGEPADVRLVSVGGRGVILQSAANSAGNMPRRVYVSFDLSAQNTNFGMSPAFVVFLANATKFLSSGGPAATAYESATPLHAGPAVDWTPLMPVEGADFAPLRAMPPPGLYRAAHGQLQAVNLVGLTGGAVMPAPANLPLPQAQRASSSVEFWPALAAAAMVLWLVGWWLRAR